MHWNVAAKQSRARHFIRALVALAFAAPEAARLAAQTPVTDPRDTTHAQSQAPFFTEKDAILAGAFVGGTLIMIPLDRHIAERLQDPSTQANRLLQARIDRSRGHHQSRRLHHRRSAVRRRQDRKVRSSCGPRMARHARQFCSHRESPTSSKASSVAAGHFSPTPETRTTSSSARDFARETGRRFRRGTRRPPLRRHRR